MILLIGSSGYIGSRLYHDLHDTHTIHCIDTNRRGNPGHVPSKHIDYTHLTRDFISHYDEVILLAGHSSVPMSVKDASGAFYNNIVAFQHLLEILDDDQRLIYASSSSVYSGFGGEAASESM